MRVSHAIRILGILPGRAQFCRHCYMAQREAHARVYSDTYRPCQVSGHADSLYLVGESSEWIVKQCGENEAMFYQDVWRGTGGGEELAAMRATVRRFMPTCSGIAYPSGTWLPGWPTIAGIPALRPTDTHHLLVLENLTQPFVRADIGDLKLGVQLYDERDAKVTQEKKLRMQHKAATTTSGSHGLRFTGWQTWNAGPSTYSRFGKAPGRAASSFNDLYDIWRALLRWDTMPHRVRLIRDYILPQLEEMRDATATLESRIYGSSILLIIEADTDALERKLQDPSRGAPVCMRLIDFAHARWCVGEGADAGFARGLDTVLRLARRTLAEAETE